jgi:hypothetical protein
MYISLAKLFLSLASAVIQYMNNKQLLEAGEAKAVLEGITHANEAIARARSARANADSLPDEADKYNRDNKE